MLSVTGKGITTKDVELRFSSNQKAVARCTIVNNEEYNGNKTAHFTNVVCFGEVAEDFAKEISKGCLIEITEGILKHPVREVNGKKYYNTEVTVLDYQLIQKFEPKDNSQNSQRTSHRERRK